MGRRNTAMSKIHTTVRVGVDGSLTLPAFFMRGMGYEPGEEVPITTPANQYICDCDANRLLVTRTCDDAECTGYTSSVPFPVSWTVKMKKKQKETQDILSYHSQAAGCSDKARAKASGGRQPIEECGRTGL